MPHRPDTLSEAVVVIVGASSGIGRGVALALASHGAKVVIAARRQAVLEAMVDEIDHRGGEALVVAMDVSDPADVARLAEATLARFGRVDVWINNVGVGAIGYFWEIPLADHSRLIDVNLKGLVYGAHVALRLFRAQRYGTLINTGSIDSETPLALQNSYAATKAAVLSLGRSLNEELRLAAADEIKVATIMPWAVDTPWWLHAANYTGHAPRMAKMDDPQIVIDAIVKACLEPREEQPVGWKAKASDISHHLLPGLTEHLSAVTAKRQAEKAAPFPRTSGAIHEPVYDGLEVDGGIRERMAREDAAS